MQLSVKLLSATLALTLLSACGSVLFKEPPTEETSPVVEGHPEIGCPIPVVYSEEFQEDLLNEMVDLPQGSVLERAMEDYLNLRDQSRACASPSK